jgi:hypothetical protein
MFVFATDHLIANLDKIPPVLPVGFARGWAECNDHALITRYFWDQERYFLFIFPV